MRHYLLGLAASSLTLIGLVGSPSLARADHHDGDHHGHGSYGWNRGHWDRDGHRWRGYYAPYPSSYVTPYYNYYAYPYYVPSYNYVYPSYGFGYTGPNLSFWVSP
jgi:hypothetical protein